MDQHIFDGVIETLELAALQAVMPRFASLRSGDIELKSPNEPVTIADREAETIITDSLRKLLPAARVVGEEACAAEPSLLTRLDEGDVWIVDPIDGTGNFAAGRPPFAMMVALLRSGEIIGSWIFDPLSGRHAVAQLGGGAWIDGERIQTSQDAPDAAGLVGIASEVFIPADKRGVIDALRGGVGTVEPTARCAGHEYPLVAMGGRHFALYWRTLVWDHAPGALLLTEAGGSVTDLGGAPYCPAAPKPGLLLAGNPGIAASLLRLVQDQL